MEHTMLYYTNCSIAPPFLIFKCFKSGSITVKFMTHLMSFKSVDGKISRGIPG